MYRGIRTQVQPSLKPQSWEDVVKQYWLGLAEFMHPLMLKQQGKRSAKV